MLPKKFILILMLTFFCDSCSFHKKGDVYDDGISTPLFPYDPPTGELEKKFNKLQKNLAKNNKAEKIIAIFARCEPYEKVMLLGCFAYSNTRHIPYGYSEILNKIRRDLLPTAKALLSTPDIQLKLKEESDMRAFNRMLSDDFDSPDNLFYFPAPDFPAPGFREGE